MGKKNFHLFKSFSKNFIVSVNWLHRQIVKQNFRLSFSSTQHKKQFFMFVAIKKKLKKSIPRQGISQKLMISS